MQGFTARSTGAQAATEPARQPDGRTDGQRRWPAAAGNSAAAERGRQKGGGS